MYNLFNVKHYYVLWENRERRGMRMDNNLLNLDDLEDVFAQLDTIEEQPQELTEEEKASMRRYQEIIKKHKQDNE